MTAVPGADGPPAVVDEATGQTVWTEPASNLGVTGAHGPLPHSRFCRVCLLAWPCPDAAGSRHSRARCGACNWVGEWQFAMDPGVADTVAWKEWRDHLDTHHDGKNTRELGLQQWIERDQ